jgi:hypothetical protein
MIRFRVPLVDRDHRRGGGCVVELVGRNRRPDALGSTGRLPLHCSHTFVLAGTAGSTAFVEDSSDTQWSLSSMGFNQIEPQSY